MAGNGENYVVGNNFDKNIDCVVGGSQSAVANLASQSDMAGGGVNYLWAKDSTRILLVVFGITLHLLKAHSEKREKFLWAEDSMMKIR